MRALNIMEGNKRLGMINLARSFLITSLIFSSIIFAAQIYAASVTLSVTVSTSLTFTTSTDQFAALTPGTYVVATTTLNVATNDASGWVVTLSGDNKSTANNNLQRTGDTTVQITDQTEWVPGVATTTTGNAVVRGSLDNSGNVLAFRVMSASSTNSNVFLATSWWGTTDVDGTAKWSGISSSTVQRNIGNAGAGSYSSSAHLNTVQYYLNAGSTQKTGTYTAPLTYTATGN